MLRKLLATGIVLTIGYVAGVFFGYRAAVVDYVENDAEKIETMADDIYPEPEQTGGQAIPDNVGELLAEAKDDESEDKDSDEGTTAFY